MSIDRSIACRMSRWRDVVLSTALMLALATSAFAQRDRSDAPSTYLPRPLQKDGRHVRGAFSDSTREAARSTVRITADGTLAALGLIVSDDGYVVTKASEVERGEELMVHLHSGIQRRGAIVAKDVGNDLALVKIAAWDLPAPTWREGEAIDVGQWVATVALGAEPLAVGVVSTPARRVTARAMLGVRLDDVAEGPIVVHVMPESGAKDAGIREGDVIVSINEQPTPNWRRLIEEIGELSPGIEVAVEVLRAGERLTLHATLGVFDSSPDGRTSRLNRLGGDVSRRSAGFESAFQHDTVLAPNECGGPLVDLDGRIVGLNIARGGRTESYAIPSEALRPVVENMLARARGRTDEKPVEAVRGGE